MKYAILVFAAAAVAILQAVPPVCASEAATTRATGGPATPATKPAPSEHIAKLLPYMTPGAGASADADRQRASQLAARAEWLIGDDQDAAAAEVLVEALTVDPHNHDALLLASTLAADLGLLEEARAGFEFLLSESPDHVPALHNLGVVLWQTGRQAEALARYDQALARSPLQLVIVHNLHEAFGALPDESADRPAAQQARKRLAARELSVASAMKRRGLFRWGSGWVTELQLRELKDTEKAIADELKALDLDYRAVTGAIAKIDAQLARIDRLGLRTDERDGRYARLPDERSAKVQELTSLRGRAAALDLRFHVPRYTGRHILVNTQGETFRPADDARIKRPATADSAAASVMTGDVATTRRATAPATNASQATRGTQP